LKSFFDTPAARRNLPAGVSSLKAPAGEMWSVVTESPRMASGRSFAREGTGGGVIEKPLKNGGSWM
jgi:hypothetical protein